jgi:hypothetical protein
MLGTAAAREKMVGVAPSGQQPLCGPQQSHLEWRWQDSNCCIGTAMAVLGTVVARGVAHCIGTATAMLGMAAGEEGDGRCNTEWRGPAHAIARVTGIRGLDSCNSDA